MPRTAGSRSWNVVALAHWILLALGSQALQVNAQRGRLISTEPAEVRSSIREQSAIRS